MKKYIIPSSVVLLIVVGVLLVIFKNTSDKVSVQTHIQKEEEIKTETKIETQTNTGELTTDDILSQLTEQVELIESESYKENEPEIVQIVTEEILYPDEYDFGESMSEAVINVGIPIQIDTLPITKSQVGDKIEINLGGENYESIISEIREDKFTADETDEDQGPLIHYWFKTEGQLSGVIVYGGKGIVNGIIDINYGGGGLDRTIKIYKNIGYHYLPSQVQAEFYRLGHRID